MKRRPVHIEWWDAASHSNGDWTPLPDEPKVRVETCAFLVRRDKDHLILAQSIDDNEPPLYLGVFTIPKRNVIRKRFLP